MQRHSRCLISVIVAMVLLMSPTAAIGQEPGVTFDDGPSSKEYAIPLDAARGQTKTKRPSAKAPAPAPGSTTARSARSTGGVTAAHEPKPKRSTKDKHSTKDKRDTKTTTQDEGLAAALPDPPRATQARVAQPVSADGTGAGVVIAGLALAALALGALAGLVLRRRRAALDER